MADKKEGLMLEYFVPIESSAELDGDFIINGFAINETTTSNGHKFLGEELSKAANTLIGVPLLKDHHNSVDSIVGKVRVAHWEESQRNIQFTAIVKDPKMIQLIKDGLLSTVSVGADVKPEDIEETEDGDIIPHNIQFKELSLVAVPADGGATFSKALNSAYKSYSTKLKEVEDSKSNERGDNMTEEEKKTESTETVETPEVPKEEAKEETKEEEAKEEPKEEPSEEDKALDEKIKALEIKAKKKKLAALLEADADEEEAKKAPEEKEKEEEEGEEAEEEDKVEEKGDYKFNQTYNSFGIERKSYQYN